jgi:hypothetical protein
MMWVRTLLSVMLVVGAVGLFADDSAVFRLTANNFKSSVLESDEFWLVEFYGSSRNTQLPGAATANIQLLSSRKQLKS